MTRRKFYSRVRDDAHPWSDAGMNGFRQFRSFAVFVALLGFGTSVAGWITPPPPPPPRKRRRHLDVRIDSVCSMFCEALMDPGTSQALRFSLVVA